MMNRFFFISMHLLATFMLTIPLCDPLEAQPELLVDLRTVDTLWIIELRYASENNFLHQKLYYSEQALLLNPVAEKLRKAQQSLLGYGYRLKIWDAYRPHPYQYKMWELVPDPRYVANPAKGSNHNRGCAVDVTLAGMDGIELIMPTDYDDFSEKAHLDYFDLPHPVIRNRDLLQDTMKEAGFLPLSTEWWHFSDPECEKYPVLDIFPEDLSEYERNDH
jgi:D-alanyl-D-alanine dipeptidase